MAHKFDGQKYAQASTHQKEWGLVLIEALQLQGCESALDLGRGDGALTARIADLLPQGSVVGIDASRGMIDAAITHSRPNLHFIVMDIEELRLNERFDVAFSNATLHWVHNHQALYERLGRLLYKGGRIRSRKRVVQAKLRAKRNVVRLIWSFGLRGGKLVPHAVQSVCGNFHP